MITFAHIIIVVLNPKRIVITGGPGTGKTSIVQKLEASGFFCFHEIIRSMTLEAKKEGNPEHFISNPLAFVSDPMLFNQKILRGRVQQFNRASEMSQSMVFFDRGIPDVLAYMNYFDQKYEAYFEKTCLDHQYDEVLLLPPWEDIYVSDNERLESFEEASDIHEHLKEVYQSFGYNPISIPKGTVKERTSYILKKLNP